MNTGLLKYMAQGMRQRGFCLVPSESFLLFDRNITVPARKMSVRNVVANGSELCVSTVSHGNVYFVLRKNVSVGQRRHAERERRPTVVVTAGEREIMEGVCLTRGIDRCAVWLWSGTKDEVEQRFRRASDMLRCRQVRTPTVGVQRHVDCPLAKRIDPRFDNGVFANPDYECAYCEFRLDFQLGGNGVKNVLCSGRTMIASYEDFSRTFEQRKKRYYAEKTVCRDCGEQSLRRGLGRYGEYWRCECCGATLSNRKLIYGMMESENEYVREMV